jgi:hypothetical protein
VKLIDAHEQVADTGENVSSQRQSFKLAAYGVKQGGIGSILAGGFNLRKKGSKKDASGHEETKPVQTSPSHQQSQQQQKEPSQQSITKANDSTGVKSSAECGKNTKMDGSFTTLLILEAQSENSLLLFNTYSRKSHGY